MIATTPTACGIETRYDVIGYVDPCNKVATTATVYGMRCRV